MRGFKNFKGSDARCPSIHFLFYAIEQQFAPSAKLSIHLDKRSIAFSTNQLYIFFFSCLKQDDFTQWANSAT